MTRSKIPAKRKEFADDLSKNKGKGVRYRIRLQQDKESQQELKDYNKYKDVDANPEV